MSKKYRAKSTVTGKEYVDAAKAFANYSYRKLEQLPERWADMILRPLYQTVDEIESLTSQANKVYIPKYKAGDVVTIEQGQEILDAYIQRKELLTKALRLYSTFDIQFERLTDHIDLVMAENKRIKSILMQTIEECRKEGITDITINVHQRISEVEYESYIGGLKLKFGLTARNKDYWLDLENKAIDELKKRIAKDRNTITSLQKAMAGNNKKPAPTRTTAA